MRQSIAFPAVLVGVGLAGAAGGVAAWEAVSDEDARPAITASPAARTTARPGLSLAELYRRAAPGVVEVAIDAQAGEDGFRTGGTGSGFVIDEEGHIVTNHHVVAGAREVTVRFANGDEARARVVGSDDSTDIALLDVEGDRNVSPLPLGSSSALSVGDAVAAIGSPYGLDGSLTSGIVSGLDRDIRAPDGFTIDGVIQTDAALNRGNSGGPLLDARGRVIGVAAQIESETGGNIGIGYAVPIDTAKEVVDQLMAGREIRRAYLGLSLAEDGQITALTPNGPAVGAGLRVGDDITAIDGRRMESADDVREALESKQPGDSVEVEVRRGGEIATVDVELGERPEQ